MSAIFPLRDGFFKPLVYTHEERAQWKQQVVGLVQLSLQEERPLLESQYERVDLHEWKLIKTKDQVRVYRPRSGSVAGSVNDSPCVLAVGTIEGTLEDVIYGIHNSSTRDIRVTRAFLSDTALDSAVLHVFENGTEDDPFRSFALKWRAIETPVGSFVKDRDGCVLEYMGIDVDEQGKRYAFQVSENFDHEVCPSFAAHGVVRADVHIRAIYRELDDGRVGVFFRGVYDMSGSLPSLLASWAAAAVAVSVGKSVECAEAKKLTALALTSANINKRLRRPRRGSGASAVCSICDASPTYLSGLTSRSAMSECQICSASVCNKCCSRKFLLSDSTKIKVQCCKQCIVDAKNFNVDARLPLRLASSAHWIRTGLLTDRARHGNDTRKPSHHKQIVRRNTRATSDGDAMHHGGEHTISTSSRTPSPVQAYMYDPMDVERESILGSNSSQIATLADNLPAANDQYELWMRMHQLRVTAEQTYRMTKESNKLMGIDR